MLPKLRPLLAASLSLACPSCFTFYSETPTQYGIARKFLNTGDHGAIAADANVRRGAIDGLRGGGTVRHPDGQGGWVEVPSNGVDIGRTVTAQAVPGTVLRIGPDGLTMTGPVIHSQPQREFWTGLAVLERIRGIFGLGRVITDQTADVLKEGIDAASN